MSTILLLTIILLPAIGGLLVAFLPQLKDDKKMRHLLVGALLVAQCVLAGLLLGMGDRAVTLFHLSKNMPIALRSDGLAQFFVLVMSLMWALSGFFSFKYMDHEKDERRYFSFYLLTLAALMALSLSATPITMYLFFEMVTLLSLALVMHERTKEAVAAGIKYLIYSVAGATMGLLGIFYLAPNAGNLYFQAGGSLLVDKLTVSKEAMLGIIFVTVIGFSTKAGMFPMHGWLPTAHPVAPSPASAVLSGVITKAGVLCVLRFIYYAVGPDFIRGTWVQLAWLGCATLTVFMGSMLAMKEKLLKKRLAWSSVSQVSYILCGLFLLDKVALEGAMLHIFFHSVTKSALFLFAGVIIYTTKKTRVDELKAIGPRMPLVMWCFIIAALGLIGIPPMGGFISKWFLVQGAIAGAQAVPVFNWLEPVTLLVSALLTAAYLMPIAIHAFFDTPDEGADISPIAVKPMMTVPLLILASIIVVFGIYPAPLINFFSGIAATLL